MFTIIIGRVKGISLVRDPGLYADEVGDEGGDVALEDGRVAPNDGLGGHVGVVRLVDNW